MLEGGADERYLRVPTIAMVAAAPVMGLLFVVFLPLMGFYLVLRHFVGRAVDAARDGALALGHAMAPQWQAGTAHFRGGAAKDEPAKDEPAAKDEPKAPGPHVAFLGRSNVGKSSWINRLLGKPGLARTSSTPGRTQSVNFYRVNDAVWFVDLPGYGYAKVPVKVRRAWGPMVEGYLGRAGAA